MIQHRLVNLLELATQIEQAAEGCPRIFVAIDGPGASGKSTLARQLVSVIKNAHLIHVDDFYLPSSRRNERLSEVGSLFDLPRLLEQVVKPGSVGKALRYQRYDWPLDRLTEWIDIPFGAPIILEGVFCLAAELRDAYTFKIWCSADPALRLARGLGRDGKDARSMWVDVWMPAENDYAALQQPKRVADLIIDSSSGENGNVVFYVVQ